MSLSHTNVCWADQDSQDSERPSVIIEDYDMKAYVAAKLRLLVPWSERSQSYQRVFAEAYQLCKHGSDFNLICHESQGRYVRKFSCKTQSRLSRWVGALGRRAWWANTHQMDAMWCEYHGIMDMAPAGWHWVPDKPTRYRVVPEGSLNTAYLDTLITLYKKALGSYKYRKYGGWRLHAPRHTRVLIETS